MRDKIAMAIAWRLPRRVVYWVVIRAAANHRDRIPADYPAERKAHELLKEWSA